MTRYSEGLPALHHKDGMGGKYHWMPGEFDTPHWRMEFYSKLRKTEGAFVQAWINSFNSIPTNILWEFATTKNHAMSGKEYFVKGNHNLEVVRFESLQGNFGNLYVLYNKAKKVFEQWIVGYSLDYSYTDDELRGQLADAYYQFGVERG